ncbi:hypothetical protein HAX54_005201 [Datura stramonium]|uniref:Uncharacterized protein n=1 Tax=Datura stramonium TaxID=4076 RepID=A0ABS8T8B6_DATST|nr:hypothetical protein [Datura stramonium]
MGRREAPQHSRTDTRNMTLLQCGGRRTAAHSPRDKACDAAPGHDFDKGDAARREAPQHWRMDTRNATLLQRVGSRTAAHSSLDKVRYAVPGHDIDKGDAARCNERPKLTSHFY